MQKHLFSLLLIGLLGLLAGYLLINAQNNQAELQSGPLLPELEEAAANVDKMVLLTAGGEKIEVLRDGDSWLMSSHGYYPVSTQKLADLLQDVVDARKLQPKTQRQEQLYRLGLASSEQGEPAELTLYTKTSDWKILVGNKPSSGLGHYVRFADSTQAWLIDQTLSVPVSAQDWMRQPILDMGVSSVLSIRRNDGTPWKVTRDTAEGEFVLEQRDADEPLRYEGVLQNYVSTLMGLNFEERVDAEQGFWDSLNPAADFTIELEDGRQISLALAKAEEQYYVSYSLESGTAYWQNSFYQISGFSAGQLLKGQADFMAEENPSQEKLPVNSPSQ
ncbi:DUF4340 domain-containing protein [Lacimicrobium sp. SS2-24]|uniref:DUF4340 domain-containing protein n=1 Tax=Lacimicrobium sp. SS2-24 TaxID=2005569 RepID=UPI000B4AA717|nr:DUF4340 domain-containing protein [Lacimicrobium sp. SS2-24]